MSDCFDWGEYQDPGDFDEPRGLRPVHCQRCGLSCTWHHTGTRWALLDANAKLHNRRTTAADPSEFAVES